MMVLRFRDELAHHRSALVSEGFHEEVVES